MEQEVKQTRPFGWKDKWAYAMGDFGCNMSFALNATITTFYTLYIGLPSWVMGIIIILLKVWDGINDPIMGALMDNVKLKNSKSKFKPWIFWGSIALIVSGAMVFLPIPAAPMWVKITVCILGYLVWDTAYTVVNVPYGSMAGVITADPLERSQLSTYRSIGAFIANIPIMIILPIVMYDGEILVGQNVFIMALVLGVFGFFAFQLLLRGTIERVKVEETPTEKKEKVNYFRVLKAFFTNKAAVAMTVASIFQLIMMNGLSVASSALFKDFFHQAELSGVIQMIAYLPMFGVIPFIKPIVRKFGKREAAAWPMVLGILAGLLMMVLPITGDTTGLVIWLLLNVLIGLAMAVFSVVGWAMVADCIDYQELREGKREDGTVYAVYSLGRKLAQGFGAAIVLFMLTAVGFQEAYVDSAGNSVTPVQTDEVLFKIRIIVGAVYFVCCLVQFVMIRLVYPLNKEKVNEITVALGRNNDELIGQQGEE